MAESPRLPMACLFSHAFLLSWVSLDHLFRTKTRSPGCRLTLRLHLSLKPQLSSC